MLHITVDLSVSTACTQHKYQINVNSTLSTSVSLNPLNAELNLICHFLALLGAHHILHVSRIRVKAVRLLMLTTHLHSMLKLRMSESLPVLPLHAFVAQTGSLV